MMVESEKPLAEKVYETWTEIFCGYDIFDLFLFIRQK